MNLIFSVLLIFLLAFPKAGLKVSGIPLTFGYVLVVFVSAVMAIRIFIDDKSVVHRNFFLAYTLSLPFQIIIIYTGYEYGYSDFGYFTSMVISFIIFPILFLILFPSGLCFINKDLMYVVLKYSIFFASVYGIAQFFFTLKTGQFWEIPYLTVNADDVGLIGEKFNDRGGIYKLVSSYNNGNIYGVCILMLLPLYSVLEDSLFMKSLVKISLLLTLSRTVWFGLLVVELLSYINISDGDGKGGFKRYVYFFFGFLFVLMALWFVIGAMGFDTRFLFDKDLGGRADQLRVFQHFELFPVDVFRPIQEMVYFSVLKQFGVIGLFSFLVMMMAPMIFVKLSGGLRSKESKATALGIFIYLIVAGIDGAISYIPVMAIYWMLNSFLVFGLPKPINKRMQMEAP